MFCYSGDMGPGSLAPLPGPVLPRLHRLPLRERTGEDIILLQLLLLIKIFHLEIARIRRFLLQLFSPMKLYLESVKMSIFHLYLFPSIKFHFEYVSRVPHRYVWVSILDLPLLSLSILNRLVLR